MIKAVIITGPTAVGKTGISLEIPGDTHEVISADSVQVYKYLDIGSGKPTLEDREKVRHHCIDIAGPDVNYTAGMFVRDAGDVCRKIAEEGKYPLFVGGTGLYIDAFFIGLDDIPEADPSVREELMEQVERGDTACLYEELSACDPRFASKVHCNDTQRIVRGLEIFRTTGRPLSSFFGKKKGRASDDTCFLVLFEEKAALADRISRRVDYMVEQGLVGEVERLRAMGYGPQLKSMKSIGYREINMYLDGKIDIDSAVELIKIETVKYAKRQITWFKKDKRYRWFHRTEKKALLKAVKEWQERTIN